VNHTPLPVRGSIRPSMLGQQSYKAWSFILSVPNPGRFSQKNRIHDGSKCIRRIWNFIFYLRA